MHPRRHEKAGPSQAVVDGALKRPRKAADGAQGIIHAAGGVPNRQFSSKLVRHGLHRAFRNLVAFGLRAVEARSWPSPESDFQPNVLEEHGKGECRRGSEVVVATLCGTH
jgi:hypothetical protein